MRNTRPRGFTVIELLVTISIAAILAAIAVPSFASMLERYRTTDAANEFHRSLMLTRAQALGAGDRVVMAPTATDGNWASGWQVFGDVNNNGVFDSGDRLIQVFDSVSSGVSVSASAKFTEDSKNFISFTAHGFPRALNGTAFADGNFEITLSGNTRRVCLDAQGRGRVTKDSGC